MYDFILRDIPKSERASYEAAFEGAQKTKASSVELWELLGEQFARQSQQAHVQYFGTFYKWYVYLTWENFTFVSSDDAPRIFAEQLHLAILLDYDPWKVLMKYLLTQVRDAKEKVTFYADLKEAIFASSEIVGTEKGQAVSLEQLVKNVISVNNRDNTSLEVAKLSSRIEQILISSNKDDLGDSLAVSPREAVSTFLDFIHFLIGVPKEDIAMIVDGYARGEFPRNGQLSLRKMTEGTAAVESVDTQQPLSTLPQEQPAPQQFTPEPQSNPEPALPADPIEEAPPETPAEPVPEPTPEPEEEQAAHTEPTEVAAPVVDPAPAGPEPVPEKAEPKRQGIPYSQVRDLIEARFQKDPNGQYENVAGVLGLLDGLAEEYNDPTLRELYYFDQSTGNFHWNESLF